MLSKSIVNNPDAEPHGSLASLVAWCLIDLLGAFYTTRHECCGSLPVNRSDKCMSSADATTNWRTAIITIMKASVPFWGDTDTKLQGCN